MTNENTITVPPLPEPLSIYALHTPAVIAAHKAAQAAHWEAKQAIERAAQRAKQQELAHANRVLNADEYYEQAVERLNERIEREREREAERFAKAEAQRALEASRPPEVSICESDAVSFLRKLEIWLPRGYAVNYHAMLAAHPGCYIAVLVAPKASKKGAA